MFIGHLPSSPIGNALARSSPKPSNARAVVEVLGGHVRRRARVPAGEHARRLLERAVAQRAVHAHGHRAVALKPELARHLVRAAHRALHRLHRRLHLLRYVPARTSGAVCIRFNVVHHVHVRVRLVSNEANWTSHKYAYVTYVLVPD